jgi:hypothetical protein
MIDTKHNYCYVARMCTRKVEMSALSNIEIVAVRIAPDFPVECGSSGRLDMYPRPGLLLGFSGYPKQVIAPAVMRLASVVATL